MTTATKTGIAPADRAQLEAMRAEVDQFVARMRTYSPLMERFRETDATGGGCLSDYFGEMLDDGDMGSPVNILSAADGVLFADGSEVAFDYWYFEIYGSQPLDEIVAAIRLNRGPDGFEDYLRDYMAFRSEAQARTAH